MRSENGIPRPFQPNQQAQELRDLKRKVAQLEARRTWVSVERIVEGGTINENVGKQITETVQRDIVIEGSNLAEGALSVEGETVEAEPKRLTAQLRTVERDNPDGVAETYAAAPSLVFSLEGEGPTAVDPGIYSFDGYSLRLTAPGSGDDPMTYVNVSPGKFQAQAVTSEIGAEFWSRNVTIGNTGLGLPGSPMADVNLLGNVKVNGNPLTAATITEFTSTGTKGNADAANQDIATPVRVPAGSNGTTANPTGNGTLTIPTTGIYSIDYHLALSKAATGRTFLDIADGNNKAYTRTTIATGEDQAASTIGGRLFNAGEQIKFRVYQNTGGTATYTATIRVTKHS